jgi:hypothetical protein
MSLDVGWAVEGGDAGARAGLVHHVDGLVGQETAGDVAVGELGGGLDGLVGEGGLVVLLVLAADALEDEDGVVHGGRLDLHGLEAAVERGVLLDILAVFVERGRADALQLAAAEGGLEDVGGVHRALGGAGTDDGVQLVDEEDDVLGALDLVHHGLDALLELAAVFGAGDHEGEVEGDDLLVGEDLRHVALGDFLREALDDGGLAHAGLADEHGVVLGAAAQDLDDAAISFWRPTTGSISPLRASSVRSRPKAFSAGVLTSFLSPSPPLRGATSSPPEPAAGASPCSGGKLGIELAENLVAGALDVDLEGLEDAGGHALTLAEQAEEDVLGADVGMVEGLGFLAGEGEDLLDAGCVGDAADGGLGFLADSHLLFHLGADGLEVEPHLLEHAHCHALPQLDQPEEEVLGADVVVVEAVGFLAGERQHLLGARGEVVHWFHGRVGRVTWWRQ